MKKYSGLYKAIERIRNTGPEKLGPQELLVFLDIAGHHPEPQSYADIALRTGTHENTIGRHIKALGNHYIKAAKNDNVRDIGMHLVHSFKNPRNTRQLIVALTKKGKKLMDLANKIIDEETYALSEKNQR